MAEKAGKKVKEWFMENVILPNDEVIDKPGCIIWQFREQDKNAFMREMLFPETMLADIENRAIRQFGKMGGAAIYRAGKRWGFRFANGGLFPQRSKSNEGDFLKFLDDFTKLVEAEYSTKFSGKTKLEKNEVNFIGKDMVICSLSGQGGLFLGAWVGCWGYMHEDWDMEGVHKKCEGRGDSECVFTCAPGKALGISEKISKDATKIEGSPFYVLNRPRECNSDFSLKRFLELGNITYEGGFFRFGDDRLVLNEYSSMYFLEDELKKIKAGKIIFDSAFDYFKKFAKGHDQEFFIGFLMATGWGEIKIYRENKGYNIVCRNFPWVSLAKDIDFNMVRGAFSGFFSGIEGKDRLFKNHKASITSGYLEIILKG